MVQSDATSDKYRQYSEGAVVTYNVYSSIDLGEAALANMLQALELANDLVCRA